VLTGAPTPLGADLPPTCMLSNKSQDQTTILLDNFTLEKRTWGGTGKTVLTSNLGVGLAILGYKVILIDADLGGADLHLSYGMPIPKRNLNDFLSGRLPNLEDVILPTISDATPSSEKSF